MSALIQCEDVWKIYRVGDMEVQALRGLSLTIEQGEFVAIMGASGSGKSTLMNILGCLDQPTKGRYRLNGIEASNLKPDQLAGIRNQQIGFVFQSFNLIPRTSALENAQLPLFYRGLSLKEQRAQAAAALGRVGLQGREHHYPTQLSGGQQQRVAIARALVTSPSLLLADEPTGNLDTQSSQEIMRILETLNRDEGITIILVTHEVDIAAYAAREIVIKDGQVLTDRVTKARPTPSSVEVIACPNMTASTTIADLLLRRAFGQRARPSDPHRTAEYASGAITDSTVLAREASFVKRDAQDGIVCLIVACEIRDTFHEERAFGRRRDEPA